MDKIDTRVAVSFILPTLNRRQWVKRALDSCLACESDSVKPHVIVIESQSDDGTFEYVEGIYGKDRRVTLRQNARSTGCVESWLEGAEMVKTPLAAFMFDDDVLSPFFKDMVECMVRHGSNFAMGFGAVHDINGTYRFEPLEGFESYSRSELLLAYFGRGNRLNHASMPVSPICCVVTSRLLRKWIQAVRVFAAQSSLRRYFMLKRGIGPDLMLYLVATLDEEGPRMATPSVVAQFSTHTESISVRANRFDLAVGYWLAKIWAFDRIAEDGDSKEAGACAAYLLLYGVRLILMKTLLLEASWVPSVLSEMWMVCVRIVKAGGIWTTLLAALALAQSEIRRRTRKEEVCVVAAAE